MVTFVSDLARAILCLTKRLLVDLCLIPVFMAATGVFVIFSIVVLVAVVAFPSTVLDEGAA